MESISYKNVMKYLTEPYYRQKLKLEDFNQLFETNHPSITSIEKEKKPISTPQANNNKLHFSHQKSNKSKSTQRMQTETNHTISSKRIKEPIETIPSQNNFRLNTENNQISIKRVQGRKTVEASVSQRKKELLIQILSERSNKIQSGPCEYTLKPKVPRKQFFEVPISSAINHYQYQYTN